MDSDEFKAWHEVGYAIACLHLGGDLDGIEFLERDARGFAVAGGCEVMPDSEKSVACSWFAAEVYLLRGGYVDGVYLSDPSVNALIRDRVFSNAWRDQQAFAGRTVTENDDFTKEENESPRFSKHLLRQHHNVGSLMPAHSLCGSCICGR